MWAFGSPSSCAAIGPVIFIGSFAGLKRIAENDSEVRFYAGVTYSEALPVITATFPQLSELWNRIAGEQVRNMGTIGGNIANGSPIGDTPPPFIALGAKAASAPGRASPRDQARGLFPRLWQAGPAARRVRRERHHSVCCPAGEQFACYKISKRRDEDISALCGAFRVFVNDAGTVGMARIAFGGMAATPKRAKAVEAALVGKPWTMATIEAAVCCLCRGLSADLVTCVPVGEYRLLTAQNLLKRFFLETTGQIERLKREVA
jgi:xanthine dehydrogenase small subunit